MEKLKHLALEKNFQNTMEELDKQEMKEAFAILDECNKYFFPSEKFLEVNLKSITRENKNVQNDYEIGLLLFHINDNKWLAKFIENVYSVCRQLKTKNSLEKNKKHRAKNVADSELPEIKAEIFEKYVATSTLFNKNREAYQYSLMKGCIKLGADDNVGDFFTSASAKASVKNSISYDWIIRNRSVKMGEFLGIDDKIIQDSIVLNSDIWQPEARRIAFMNNVNPDRVLYKNDHAWLRDNQPKVLKAMQKMEIKLYEDWNAYRDYSEYQEYGEVFRRLNKVNANMKMSPKKAEILRQNNVKMIDVYKASLRECDNRFPILKQIREPKPIEPTINL